MMEHAEEQMMPATALMNVRQISIMILEQIVK